MMRKTLLIITFFSLNIAYCQSDTLRRGTIGYFLKNAVEKESEKKYEEAIIITDSAMTIDSNNENIYGVKAEILWMMKNYYQAALNYQKALLLDKDRSFLNGAYLFLGVLYEKAGLRVHAQTQYLKAIYFFEHRKRNDDKYFANVNKIDYAIALKLSGNEKVWEKLLDEPFYQRLRLVYIGKSRDEILEMYFKQFCGG